MENYEKKSRFYTNSNSNITTNNFNYILFTLSFFKKKIDFNNLEQQNNIRELDLSNSYSTALYEFSLIDKYITEGIITNKEEYISTILSGEKIWATDRTRNTKSIGGFVLSMINPPISSLSFSGEYSFTFELLKKINLTDENQLPFLDVYIYTNPFHIKCFLDKKFNSLLCEDSSITFNNFRCLGEVISNASN